MENKDYYKILGLTEEDKKLSQDEFQKKLKKVYRDLSIKYHPDRNPGNKEAEEKFKEINEAHDTLSDPKKRQQYDFQSSGGFNFGGFDPFEGFGDHFSDMMGGFGHFTHRQRTIKGEDANVSVDVTLEDVLNGVTKTIKFNKLNSCIHCNGTGSKNGKTVQCPKCGGSGMIKNISRMPNQTFIQTTTCPECGGTGTKPSEKCQYCNGTGVKKESVTKTITIPKGIFDGACMTFKYEGNSPMNVGNNNSVAGNLNLYFHVLPHGTFTIDGQNLRMDMRVNLFDAWNGCEKMVKCLDGTVVRIRIPKLTEDGKQFQVRGKGLPNVNDNNNIGSLIIRIKYEVPTKLTDKQLDLLEEFYELEEEKKQKH